ncbi:RsmB/NOP family class I SAM-dependent RNA methyltransferase [Synoicihabitans lomoniglobus]|uniref:RsmB/NOP family class I SAM-dependent RNA methyltransferase n=1 Tax=Synoicihabitans lomoniglobus TaxID=2909285 RepID=A0AAF0I549_9BACT|nr:RsmB/NOP family class I SAM-dependent RNA methyltransferase [Opitutaceae bacterium LMO-M01]WED67183.1 RsmB/NOP family class I SAM-dependent RNA methyltransferase [Opitutaceae bacterium LMO-M01]
MSRVDNQRRLFLELIEELRPWWRRDPGLPQRLAAWLARHRAGSRDRRLYRELAYTAWRILPWVEDAAPDRLVGLVAQHAEPSRATTDFIAAFGHPESPVPDTSLFPAWLDEACPGMQTAAQRPAMLSRAPLWIRLQTSDATAVAQEFSSRDITFTPSDIIPGAWRVDGEVNLATTAAYRDGLIEIQDIGSQALLHSLPAPLAGHWLDACAGAGGKTLQLAGMLGTAGKVTAHDVRGAALQELSLRVRRARLTNVSVDANPTGRFDGVLVDAPCSGSGTWRRSPHLKWTTTPESIRRAVEKQLFVLDRFAPLVADRGLLVYATCSLCRAENEDVIASFQLSHPHFSPVPLRHPATGEVVRDGHLALLPADLDSDAYFVAAFRRS